MTITILEKALEQILVTDAAVSAMVIDRVYLGLATQEEEMPYICIDNDGGDPPDKAMSGPTGLASRDIIIDCRAASGADAVNLAGAVMFALDGYRADVDGFSINLIEVMEPVTSDEKELQPVYFGQRMSATVTYHRPKGNQQ